MHPDPATSLPTAACRGARIVGAALLIVAGLNSAHAADAGPLPLTVDASRSAGRLKPLNAVNGQPISHRYGETDATQGYRDARVSLVRVHDTDAGDIDSFYSLRMPRDSSGIPKVVRPAVELNDKSMFLNPDADPEDPRSYNFGPTDTLITQIRATGAQPLFRLGRSWAADSDPPSDMDKWARVAAHVVMHYNQGWADGFHYGIRYWEIWNEPDMSLFWQGQPEDYYQLYAKVAPALKAVDPSIMVGGPTQSLPLDERPYGSEFLEYVRDHHLPLDFFSWHWYAFGNDPYDFARMGRILRDRLDARGFTKTVSIIDEWNSTLAADGNLGQDTGARAAFIASALAYMQEAPVDQQAIYRADRYFVLNRRTREGSVLVAWGKMQDTPQKLAVSGTRTDGFTAVAGKSDDGKLVQVFVSSYEVPAAFRSPDKPGPKVRHIMGQGNFAQLRRQDFGSDTHSGYALTLTGLDNGRYTIKRFRISDRDNFDLVETRTVPGGTIELQSDLAPQGVEFLQITREP
jgi:xylan 1,4-beta-xylosidase